MHAPVRWDIPLLFTLFGVGLAGAMLFVLACFHAVRSVKMPAPPDNARWRKK